MAWNSSFVSAFVRRFWFSRYRVCQSNTGEATIGLEKVPVLLFFRNDLASCKIVDSQGESVLVLP